MDVDGLSQYDAGAQEGGAAAPAAAAAASASASSAVHAAGGVSGVGAPAGAAAFFPDMAQSMQAMQQQLSAGAAHNSQVQGQMLALLQIQMKIQQRQDDKLAVSLLTKPENREMARYLTAVSECADGKDRAVLTKAFIEMTRVLEQDSSEIDEAKTLLKRAVKSIKSMSADEHDEMIERLKPKKRKDHNCARCGREGHAADKCYASVNANGDAIGGGGKRQKAQPMYAAPAQTMAAPAAAAAPAVGGPSLTLPRPGPECWTCRGIGHRQSDCPNRKAGGAAAAASAPQVSEARERGKGKRKAGHEADAHTSNVLIVDAVVDVVRDCYASKYSAEDQKEIEEQMENGPGEKEETSDSIAGSYMDAAWEIEDSEESAGEAPQENSCSSAALMYSTSLESAHTEQKVQSTLDVAPVLSSRAETQRTLAELALAGEEIMPAGVRSLRAAMQSSFGGKKKVLCDEDVLKQTCVRCKKIGHTAFSCPDQTQEASADRTAADAWVRRLIELPRVDIAVVNAGLTLEEGVARWRARGEEMNRGNPWAGSTKMEDSLKKQLGFHKAMGMGRVHLGWIGFGVPLKFIEERHPRKLAFRNHASAMEEQEFVDKEHESNLRDGSFVEVPREFLKGICPLQVVKHPVSGKKRLVQDLRWINGHLPNVKFRMESLHKELGEVVQQGDQLMTTDIAKAYYCLALHPDAQQYLGWEWKGKFYMPTCLVFGLASAPRIFTKIMRPMMAFMRSLAVRVLGMIDDYLWAARANRILALRTAVQTVFPLLGWSFNAKCEWEPSDEVLMLGMLVNALKFEVRAPQKKINATLANLSAVLRKVRGEVQRPVTVKELQILTGRLMSMMLALPGVRVFTRSLYQALAVALEGNEGRKRVQQPPIYTLQLKSEAIGEIEFWLERLLTHNGLEINCRENQVQVLLWSDASDVGWGGEAAGAITQLPAAQVQVPRTPVAHMAHGALAFREIARSSTRRELVALMKVAATPNILDQIRGKRIRVIMDSIPALRNLIKGGGPVPELCEAVRDWTHFCELHHIKPVYEWVERAMNWRADAASKLQVQQHTLRSAQLEATLRRDLNAVPATQWRARNNHFVWGKVPLFLPMFHQVDARVEMIRAQLEEAIIVVPRWPAGGTSDWWRRVAKHSIAQLSLGKVSAVYAEKPQTGHDDELEAFWIMGRRGEKNRAKLLQLREEA